MFSMRAKVVTDELHGQQKALLSPAVNLYMPLPSPFYAC